MSVSNATPPGLKSWKAFVRIPEFPAVPSETALVVIDMTKQQASRDHGICKKLIDDGFEEDLRYYLDRIEGTVMPALERLVDAFHRYGSPVLFTRCVSLRGDGSDQTWRHRHFGLVTTLDSEDSDILRDVAPSDGDIVLNKTGSSVFNGTNLEHLLRNMGITTIVVTGIFTNSCVEGTIRDAGDRDFRALMAEDACAAMSPVGHANAIDYLDKNFCHVKSSDEVLALMRASSSSLAEAAR